MTRPGSGNLASIGCSHGEDIMTINLPRIIESYVDASNRHDLKSITV